MATNLNLRLPYNHETSLALVDIGFYIDSIGCSIRRLVSPYYIRLEIICVARRVLLSSNLDKSKTVN